MYCVLQYIDIKQELELGQTHQSSVQTVQSVNSTKNEPKRLMINPNCPMQILLEYVCSEIGIDINMDFDICDSESGILLGVKELKPWYNTTNIFKFKQTYVIVFYEKDQFGQYKVMEPLISKQSKQYSDILNKLKKQFSSLRRMSSGMRKSKRLVNSGSTIESHESHKNLNQKEKQFRYSKK